MTGRGMLCGGVVRNSSSEMSESYAGCFSANALRHLSGESPAECTRNGGGGLCPLGYEVRLNGQMTSLCDSLRGASEQPMRVQGR